MEKLQFQLPKKEKLQFFLLFVALSFTFWTITKFSNTYQLQRTFQLSFSDIPDHITLGNDPLTLSITLTSSGFQMARYGLFNKKIILPFSNVIQNGNQGIISIQEQYFEIQKQLYSNTTINSIDTQSLQFEFATLNRKRLPLRFEQHINFKVGYHFEDTYQLTPDSVWISGPVAILDTLSHARLVPFYAQNVAKDINEKVMIQRMDGLRYSHDEIRLTAAVSRYTELTYNVPIQIENVPEGVRIKLFPQRVDITLIIPYDALDQYKADEIIVACNYEVMTQPESKSAKLYAVNIPAGIKKMILSPEEVTFLIRQ